MTGRFGLDHVLRCAPSGVHRAFVEAVKAYDDEEMRFLAGMLFRCRSALSDEFCRWLGVSAGTTYGDAAERIWTAAALRARDRVPPPTPPATPRSGGAAVAR